MPFRYLDTLATSRDKIRFKLGDTIEDNGPRPDKRNFSDNEIGFFLSDESTVNAAVAAGFETLAAEWSAWALIEREGEATIDAKAVAAEFEARAKEWRNKDGGGAVDNFGSRVGYVMPTRQDGYA